MTVLMFGWEFPPHMSGGLGTACFGLTHALMEEKTTILFVVPKAHGDEAFPLINASDVLIDKLNYVQDFSDGRERVEGLTKIHIPAVLIPYGNTIATDTIEHWGWEYPSNLPAAVKVGEKVKYEFTGKYGPLLMDEVTRYADVASKIASAYSFDVIHAHDWLTYPAAIRAQQTSGRPLIVHVHATEFDRAGANSINEKIFDIEKHGMDASDLIIAVSQWTKDILVERYGVEPEKVRVVHNGVVEEHPFDRGNSLKVGTHVVTFLGRITYQKGPEYFIHAARKILDYFPETHFVMAGSGDLLPAMLDRVAELRLSSRIHFTGFLKGKQIEKIWSLTDVYVMPSVSEPFGITPLEAIQAGVPVILSNQSGVSEVIDHAIKVDFWDTDALANAIINVLRHDALSHSLRENSRQEIQNLTWNRAAKKIKDIYNELNAKR
jgi:glycogen synthase